MPESIDNPHKPECPNEEPSDIEKERIKAETFLTRAKAYALLGAALFMAVAAGAVAVRGCHGDQQNQPQGVLKVGPDGVEMPMEDAKKMFGAEEESWWEKRQREKEEKKKKADEAEKKLEEWKTKVPDL